MSNSDDKTSLALHAAYAAALREHAVMLIWMGHQRLSFASLSSSEEDDITGELVRAIKEEVCSDSSAPEWVDHYEVHEQTRQSTTDGKRGKRRPMMDIEIECHRRGPRPKLGFEAKRLGHGHTAKKYLGDEGMTAFLTNYYPTTHGEAGMIGYVQQDSTASWAKAIFEEVLSKKPTYCVVSDAISPICRDSAAEGFLTEHTDQNRCSLKVLHVFLPFC
jgi:hypothetical protein